MEAEVYKKITNKKEFSNLREIDVKKAWQNFERREVSVEEKIKLTRDLLRRVYTVFTSQKLLNIKDRDEEWFLKKHISTKERFPFYKEIYQKILEGSDDKTTIFDFGAGINGVSYNFFTKGFRYIGVESIGQLVNLTNSYFVKENIKRAKTLHLSLFELELLKKLILKGKGKKVIFLFKVLDSLEMIEKNYSKKLLESLVPFVEKVVVSFATRSLLKRTKFKAKRSWILKFIEEKFKIENFFEFGDERYVVFTK